MLLCFLVFSLFFFFFNDTATTEIYTLSLHDALPIHPTPVIGVLGVLDDAARAVPAGFPREGLQVWLLGTTAADFGGSAWQRIATGRLEGRPPALDLEAEAALHGLLVELARARLAAGAHDLSEGGLAIALVEAVLSAGVEI